MKAATARDLLREARLRHGLTTEDLAIRAGTDQVTITAFETGEASPSVETLGRLLELLGEELVLAAETRLTGIDLPLNQCNLKLSPDQRVRKGLAFADLVRQTRPGTARGLGRSLRPDPIFRALGRHDVDFVVIGSIAGLGHGSAYPTYDLDLAWDACSEDLVRLASALDELGVKLSIEGLTERSVLSLETEFGRLDIVRQVPGVKGYEQLRRDAALMSIGGSEVPVASLDHLIAMKQASRQRKDLLMAMEYVELADEIRRRDEES